MNNTQKLIITQRKLIKHLIDKPTNCYKCNKLLEIIKKIEKKIIKEENKQF